MAQRIEELKTLPFGLHTAPNIRKVIDWYSSFVDTLTSIPKVTSEEDEHAFAATIESQLQTPSLVTVMLSAAVMQSGASLDDPGTSPGEVSGGATRKQQVSYLQGALDRFFTARIGLRFLMEHHVRSFQHQEDGWSGIIKSNFCPAEVLRDAAADAQQLCEDEFGLAPEVELRTADVEDAPSETRNNKLTYVPSHMHYICTELLKNAMRATAERHKAQMELPPVVVTAAFGREHLGVRISDEGGGIPLTELRHVWRYAYTTAPIPLIELEDDSSQPPQTLRRSALAGYGMGLPLSRLYAQYLGGRLDLRSLEGSGTDCFLHLPRLGTACETLPTVVRASAAERDSTPGGGGHSMRKLSAYEYAVLSEKLAEIRHES